MASVGLGARMVLALVFTVAAVGKLADQPGTRTTLREFRVPESALTAVALALPVAELVTAAALLVQPSARWGQPRQSPCWLLSLPASRPLWSAAKHPTATASVSFTSEPAGPGTLIRNALLAAPAVFVVAYGPGTSLDSWLPSHSTADALALIAGVAAAALAAFVLQLICKTGRCATTSGAFRMPLRTFQPGRRSTRRPPGSRCRTWVGRRSRSTNCFCGASRWRWCS